MEDIKFYSSDCYEISPGLLKDKIQILNPLERILQDFLDFYDERGKYNVENYNKFVRKYYIYKNQFKKYGLTFKIVDGDQEYKKILSKLFFFPKNIYLDIEDFEDIKEVISLKGKDYKVFNLSYNANYKEEDDKGF